MVFISLVINKATGGFLYWREAAETEAGSGQWVKKKQISDGFPHSESQALGANYNEPQD